MAKFNPHKIQAFRDFLDMQTALKHAQKSYEDVKRMEQVTDAIMAMGIEVGAAAQMHHIRSRNRKRLLLGLALAGGAYLYNNAKKKASSRTGRGYIDYSKPRAKQSSRRSEEVKSYAK